jgi:PHD/YefM family antitoxin component YafN of YafNO toxin-antitoxin module
MNYNTLSVAELKRRGMSAIDEGLQRGPLHIVKRNKMAAVVLSEDDYLRLTNQKLSTPPGLTAMQWLLAQPSVGRRSKAQIDADLHAERAW